MTRITLTINHDFHSALKARAKADGACSRSAVARAALVAYLEARKKLQEPTAQPVTPVTPTPETQAPAA